MLGSFGELIQHFNLSSLNELLLHQIQNHKKHLVIQLYLICRQNQAPTQLITPESARISTKAEWQTHQMRGTVEFPGRDFLRELIENKTILNIVRFGGQVSDWSILRVEICSSIVTIFRIRRTGRHVGRSIGSSNDGPQALVRRDIDGAVGLRRLVLHRYKYSRCWSC